jgi:3-deoxy-D-manno-octulosonic-acid transferase
MGTLKEGSAPLPDSETERVQFTSAWGHRPTWLAASTHPGEEELIAEAHDAVRKSVIGLGLILAPRHPERGDAITNTLRNGGWLVAQRSKDDPIVPETQIYVADTLGEMGIWFRASPVSFIGGSLVPIGGHNPFEPAALGSAIIHGPHVDNFRDIYTRLADADACVRVEDAHSLARSLSRVLAPDEAARIATAAWETCSDGAEVTDRVIKVLEDLMAA